mgnify:FL=1
MKLEELYADGEVPQIIDVVQFEPEYRIMGDIAPMMSLAPSDLTKSIDYYFPDFRVYVLSFEDRNNQKQLLLASIKRSELTGFNYDITLPAFIFRKVKT